uniref:Late blight resistance protein n=1 Tax=Solanum tuberosum TaxID=4113 RepID=M1DZE5_SOLTU
MRQNADPSYVCLHHKTMQANWHQYIECTSGTHGHHPRTVGGPTVHPEGPWFVLATSPRTQSEIRPSVNPRPDLRSVGQVTDRGLCPWIDGPKAQLQSRLTVDQHGPSFDPRSVAIMPHRRANTRNANARNANTVPLVPDQGVLNAEFQNTI